VNPSYGVVVVGYESEAEWEGFFSSLQQSTISPDQIVVVDNSPHLSVAQELLEALPLQVIHQPSNPGYGAAANAGMATFAPEIEWVVVCNPDTRFEPDTLELLLAERDAFPRTGVLGPCIVSSLGMVYPSARAIPGMRIGIGHALFARLWPTNPWTQAYLGTYTDLSPRSVGWLSGAFLLINRDVMNSVGGFDERFFMFFEDVDLGMRIKQAGYRNVYVPRSRVSHSGAASTTTHHKEMLLAHHRSAERFLSKLYPHTFQAPVRLALRAGLRIRAWLQTRNLR
jgi:N-acetylglucosaminyl-diphospho-decaprenol L-rhamnosyltransferase